MGEQFCQQVLASALGRLIGAPTTGCGEGVMELAAGFFGVFVGSGVTLFVAWLNHRWRREDVRAAEKRVRWEERFEPVWRYATGLQEFVYEAGHLMERWEERRLVEGWESLAQELQGQLEMLWEDLEALRPRPGPLYVVQDKEARKWYLALRLGAAVCRHKCRVCLGVGAGMSEEDASGFAADADEALKKLLEQMRKFVEKAEG